MSFSRADKTISLDDLMREHYAYIYRLACSILDDPDEAEDAAQETFIRAAVHLPEFRGEAEIKTWLTSIAVNACRGELRKRRARGALEKTIRAIQSLVGKTHTPEEQADENELQAQLRRAVAGLDEKHRLPVILHYLQHMNVSQIASMLETNENTIHSRLFHARRKLAMKLGAVRPEAGFQEREDVDVQVKK